MPAFLKKGFRVWGLGFSLIMFVFLYLIPYTLYPAYADWILDLTPPTVSISPTSGTYNANTNVVVTFTCTDNNPSGCATLIYSVTGVQTSPGSCAPASSCSINVTGSNGDAQITATGIDTAGNITTSSSIITFLPPATAPGSPTGLSCQSNFNAQVPISWTAPSDGGSPITGYRIYRSTTPGGEILYSTPPGTGTTYTDNSVTNGTPYYYKVSAVNAIGEGGLSNECTATPSTIPTAPTLSVTTGQNAQVPLSWTIPSSGGSVLTSYKLYRSTTPGGETFLVNPGLTTNYTNTGLTNGTTYYYKVSALNANGEGPLSNEVNATPQSLPELIIQSITPNPANIFVGDSITWSAVVQNNGGQSAGVTYTRFVMDGGAPTDISTPIIAGGTSTTVSWSGWSATAGNHTLTVTADISAVVVESNELNNTGTYGPFAPFALPTCNVSPNQGSITTGNSATWTASPAGGLGAGTYTYPAWSDNAGHGPTGTGSTNNIIWAYGAAGSYTATATVSSGGKNSTCQGSLSVSNAPPFIQTQQGDVHTNTQIIAPGKPSSE